MRIIERRVMAAVRVLALAGALAIPAQAQVGDFYDNMLRRGIVEYSAGRFEPAARQLRIAAFGLITSIDRYQIAHVYLALASDRLGRQEDVRYSASRVVAAERIQRRYATLDLPTETRAAFDALAAKALTADALALLRAPAPQPQGGASTPGDRAATQPPSTTDSKPPIAKPPTRKKPAPKRPAPQPRAQQPAPQPQPPTPVVPAAAAAEIAASLENAERALSANRLADARTIYRDALERVGDDRSLSIRIAEGLYRSRDFAGVLRAFQRIAPLRRGEEPYGYYLAVALYETGDFAAAKRELRAALPSIQETADVTRYREKIESAND